MLGAAFEVAQVGLYVMAMLESDDNCEIPSTYSWVEKAEGGVGVGLEPWEYILFRTAYSMIESDEDADGKTIRGSKQEKAIDALVDMTWLTDAEGEYIFGTLYSSD